MWNQASTCSTSDLRVVLSDLGWAFLNPHSQPADPNPITAQPFGEPPPSLPPASLPDGSADAHTHNRPAPLDTDTEFDEVEEALVQAASDCDWSEFAKVTEKSAHRLGRRMVELLEKVWDEQEIDDVNEFTDAAIKAAEENEASQAFGGLAQKIAEMYVEQDSWDNDDRIEYLHKLAPYLDSKVLKKLLKDLGDEFASADEVDDTLSLITTHKDALGTQGISEIIAENWDSLSLSNIFDLLAEQKELFGRCGGALMAQAIIAEIDDDFDEAKSHYEEYIEDLSDDQLVDVCASLAIVHVDTDDEEEDASDLVGSIPADKPTVRVAALRKIIKDCSSNRLMALKGIVLDHLDVIGAEAAIELKELIEKS